MGSIGVSVWHVAIPVRNLEQAVRFYCSLLGFQLLGFDEYESKRQAFVVVEEGGFHIELFEPKQDKETKLNSKPDHLAFEAEDLASFRKSLLQKDIPWEIPEIDTFENGIKYLGMKDQDGMSIEFFQGRKIYEDFLRRQDTEVLYGTHQTK